MKRFTKICLILVFVCCILGCGFLVGGIAVGATVRDFRNAFDRGDFTIGNSGLGLAGWFHDYDHDYDHDDDYDDDHDDDHDRDHHSYSYEASTSKVYDCKDVKNITVDMRGGGFYMEEGDGDTIRVETLDEDGRRTTVTLDGNELIFENDYRNFNGEIIVYCPKDMTLDELDISIGGGEGILAVPLTVHDLDVEIGAGRFESCEKIHAEQSSWSVGAGELVANGISGDDISFECGMGEIEAYIDGKETDYNYELECGMGTLKVGDMEYAGIGRQQDITNTRDDREIDISCSMGEVAVYFNK